MSSQSTLDAINIWSYLCSLRLKGKLDWDDGEIFRTVLNSARNKEFFFVRNSRGFPSGILMYFYYAKEHLVHVKLLAAETKHDLSRLIKGSPLGLADIRIAATRRGRPMILDKNKSAKYLRKIIWQINQIV